MRNKFQLTILASILAVTLSGCSSDDSEEETVQPIANSAPTLKIVGERTISINERDETTIQYNVLDNDVNDTHTVSYEVSGMEESELRGSISLDTANKTLVYSVDDIQVEENFNILLNVKDSAGNFAEEGTESDRTVSISVKNVFNEAPQLSFSGFTMDEDGMIDLVMSPSNNEGIHFLTIPYEAIDSDQDEIEVTLGTLTNITGTVELNEDDSTITLEIPEIYDTEKEGMFTFSIFDGSEITTATFNITVAPTQVSPEMEISNKTIISSGVVPTEIEYGVTIHAVNFNKSDKNGDTVFITAQLSEPVADFDENVVGNTVNLTNIFVEEDKTVTLTLTATDQTGTEDVVDSIELSILACTDCAYVIAEEKKDLYLSQYGSLKSRQDESKLLTFYTDYLLLTDQLSEAQVESHKETIKTNYLSDKNSVESKITEVNTEFDKVDSNEDLKDDKAFVETLNVLLVELESLVSNYGETNIQVLNQLASIDSKLPTLLTNQKIKSTSVEYSKYVGNNTYGYLSNSVEWIFLTEYEILEIINVLSAQCK
jgi:hypothetical protein